MWQYKMSLLNTYKYNLRTLRNNMYPEIYWNDNLREK